MPLIKSASKAAVSENIRRERDAGKPQRQAVAIALDIARRAKRRADGGEVGGGDPFALAAQRRRQTERPEGGRRAGMMTKVADQLLPFVGHVGGQLVHGIGEEAQRAMQQSANRVAGSPDLDMGPATNLASMAMGAGFPFAKAGAAADTLLASKSAGLYNPPVKPARPFEADYPSGAPADVNGRLLADIEGRQLTAQHVVGRRTLGGADEALSPADVDALTKATTGAFAESVPQSALPRNSVGAYRVVRGADGPERSVNVLRSLSPTAKDRVAGHEFAHLVDDLSGQIPTEGLVKQLERIYNTMGTGEERTRHLSLPKGQGYSKSEIPREYWAEAIRAYIADPNYLKTVAPDVAARIRQYANVSPRTKEYIQFNASGPPVIPPNSSVRGEDQMAAGGAARGLPYHARARKPVHTGPIASPIGGRTDHIPLAVPSGAYVIAADIVSGLGQGNTANGHAILNQMFSTGPHGSKLPKMPLGSSMPKRANGGATDTTGMPTEILAAGGEHVLTPEQVAAVGNGDLDVGHRILDAFMLGVRKDTIKKLKSLPGPAKD